MRTIEGEEIKHAIEVHGICEHRLARAIKGEPSELQPERFELDHFCDFGRWLSSLSTTDQASEHFKEVRALHATFHKEAARILRLARAGQSSAAKEAMTAGGVYARVSGNLTAALLGWAESVQAQRIKPALDRPSPSAGRVDTSAQVEQPVPDLDGFIDRAKHLPPAPALLPELLDMLNRPDVDSDRIVRLITYDPALTANVLRLCNSAVMASRTRVSSLEEAVLQLGFGQIYCLVAASCGVHSMGRSGRARDARERKLWSHSVVAAVGAQLIARDQGSDANLAFTAALLHDIGKIVVADVLDEKYTKLVEEVEANHYSLIDMERRVFGLQHAELGGRLLARWKFPLNLVVPVCFHHNPVAAAGHQSVAACIYAGNLIAYLAGHGCGNPGLLQAEHHAELGILKLDHGAVKEYTQQVQSEFAKLQVLIQMGT